MRDLKKVKAKTVCCFKYVQRYTGDNNCTHNAQMTNLNNNTRLSLQRYDTPDSPGIFIKFNVPNEYDKEDG